MSAGQPLCLVLAVPPSQRALVPFSSLAESEPWPRAAHTDRPLRPPSRPDHQRKRKDATMTSTDTGHEIVYDSFEGPTLDRAWR
ncbi:hypothetical protein STRIP9103_08463 [Streptomyces ipomoeae 91-03]|uniref:Uncharacterized protein n=1 Tax=Streptomyces ipomoeae 91-03 TaxID=698759 RepID=L1KVS7_9ACTN|nr:hypothetical protein STRIP9103_08463 [Streptomyces ipomoeae 91-03]